MTCDFRCLPPRLRRRLMRVADREDLDPRVLVCDAVRLLLEGYRNERTNERTSNNRAR